MAVAVPLPRHVRCRGCCPVRQSARPRVFEFSGLGACMSNGPANVSRETTSRVPGMLDTGAFDVEEFSRTPFGNISANETPIAAEAQRASQVLHPGNASLPRPREQRVIT